MVFGSADYRACASRDCPVLLRGEILGVPGAVICFGHDQNGFSPIVA